MRVFRLTALAMIAISSFGFASPLSTLAADISEAEGPYDGFGFYAPQMWKNKEGKTARLSICNCDYDSSCFGERILFRKPNGGFIIIPRSELHPDSLNRIDAGLKKLAAQKPLNHNESPWANWKGRNGIELSMKLIASDAEMAVFVDRSNQFRITNIQSLDNTSKAALFKAATQKFTKGAVRLVSQIDPRPFEKKILDGIDARAEEIKSIGLRNNVVSASEIDAWFLEARQGVTFSNQSVEWNVPVENIESSEGIEADLSSVLFNQLFQLVNLPTADFEQLKNASSVKAFKKRSEPQVGSPSMPPKSPPQASTSAAGSSIIDSSGNEEGLAAPVSNLQAPTNLYDPVVFQTNSHENSELAYGSYGDNSADCNCFMHNETVYESRCRLIGWLRRLR
jgi:hypothetical protein